LARFEFDRIGDFGNEEVCVEIFPIPTPVV